ncbi:low molecular weight protein-tyrosine-phosphatase [Antarctobacter heliothermus]|uniref:protein-tyrosine-phosphatase n=1 Tax=Antarctobacter heliothermus TaxID=74033 RepID=A0A239DD32_9RHOB|nr:low molecular weight protein-tyrosine-phosphatase [Antarctobacter heliothermus]SNS30207.1 protein-tyrosine phosphatase [Antarctobacter heliothermus]
MFRSVLVVCVGNICRSPVGERLLSARLRNCGSSISVSSAGIGALVGHCADETAAAVAAEHGVDLDGHVAQQFSRELGLDHDLILTMEPGHRREIIKVAPDLSGRVMLFDHWQGGKGIADPYRRSRQFHEEVFSLIDTAGSAWAAKLAPAAKG